jgi:hypothetical protein
MDSFGILQPIPRSGSALAQLTHWVDAGRIDMACVHEIAYMTVKRSARFNANPQ